MLSLLQKAQLMSNSFVDHLNERCRNLGIALKCKERLWDFKVP